MATLEQSFRLEEGVGCGSALPFSWSRAILMNRSTKPIVEYALLALIAIAALLAAAGAT